VPPVERQILVDWDLFNTLLASLGEAPAQAAALVWGLYQHQIADQFAQLGIAVAATDRPRIQQMAHRLRGGSHQLGAVALSRCCMQIEALAATDADLALTNLLRDARDIYDQTLAQVAARLADVG
jgi:HPt (histidine-containing phosphotransfer) domain-containing protein